ncbi:MAG TPA: DUF6282 family protein, partial [Candidatus Polarisedimenticolaceae bacterium]|nr:DUF6282 family protein [Candidatus Polarisedimenticolaceae bacterium]
NRVIGAFHIAANLLYSATTRSSPKGSAMLTQENFSAAMDEVMHGAIDMHVHFGPDMPPTADLAVARRLDGIGTARQARDAGMRAVVMKSHHCLPALLSVPSSRCFRK